MATYTPNEQLKDIVTFTYSSLNVTSTSFVAFSGLTVPSGEYWKVRPHSASLKADVGGFHNGTFYYRKAATGNFSEVLNVMIDFNPGFIGSGTIVQENFRNTEEFLPEGYQIGFKNQSGEQADFQIYLTIFKYAIF